MAQFVKELDLRFYRNNDVSIDINSASKVVFLDIALLSLYIIRWFSNIGGIPELAMALRNASNVNLKKFNIGDYLVLSNIEILDPRIVSKRDCITKSFKATMSGFEYQQQYLFGILLDFQGFDFVGNDLNYYGIQSINALIRYYALFYEDNKNVQDILQHTINRLGYICTDNEVIAGGNIIRQGQEVLKILYENFGQHPY
jgi:hypothetical protein